MTSHDSHKVRVSAIMVFAATAATVVACFYWRTLGWGFDYGDYHFVHTYSLHEVVTSWTGNWDPSGIEPRFWRPLAVTFNAARVWLLGVDPWRLRLLGLVMFVCAGLIIAALVYSLGYSLYAAMVGLLLFLLNPVLPYLA